MTAAGSPARKPDSLLLVLMLGVHSKDGRVYIESQAANGLAQWLRNFGSMTLAVKLLPGDPPADHLAIDSLGFGERLSLFLMPPAWTPLEYLRAYPDMSRKLSALIDSHEYLHFTNSVIWGDWGGTGALIAARKGRKACYWTDRVESAIARVEAERRTGVRRLFGLFTAWLTERRERAVLRRTALGLFHGHDTFTAYSPYTRNPHLVHNIHIKPADQIGPDALAAKIAALSAPPAPPLDIVYAGRVHPDKGVMDWIETLRLCAQAGLVFRARWFGDGPQLAEARARVEALGLADRISFPGALTDRAKLLAALRAAHVMLFCHLTPESPRCLIEALVSGTPIVGYGSAYPEDLVAAHGGGLLTAMDPAALSKALLGLAQDRQALGLLCEKARQDGAGMTDEAVFDHRAQLMKTYL
ncbi:MAG: glycosyltransferase [Sphingomonadales bacterium]|nr:glycosyltransferase [Sphingomonadales bacterium]